MPDMKDCTACGGSGTYMVAVQDRDYERECQRCDGTGKVKRGRE